MIYIRQTVTIVLMLGLAACATSNYGREFDATKASEIKTGVTTKAQVQALVGQPSYRTRADGKETWLYSQGSVSVGTAGSAAKVAAGTVATTAIGMLIPGAGMFAMLGTTMAGGSAISSTSDVAMSSKSLTVMFEKDLVTYCSLQVTKGSHASETDGPSSDSETTNCGG